MRQRNISGSPLSITDIPATVPPGGEIEFDEPLAGFEPVDEPASDKSSRKKSSASKATGKETTT